MIGKITERDMSEVKPISSIVGGSKSTQALPVARNMGFPSAKSTLSLAAPRKRREAEAVSGTLPKPQEAQRTGMQALAFPPPARDASSSDSADGDDNTRVIHALTTAERNAAIQEVEGMLSPEALEFLRNRSKPKQAAAAAPSKDGKEPRTVSSSSSSAKGGSATASTATAPGPIATTLDGLWAAQRSAPPSVLENLAWTKTAAAHPRQQQQQDAAAAAAAPTAAARAVAALKDRYELSGLKLVEPAEMAGRISSCLVALGLGEAATAELAAALFDLATAHLCSDVQAVVVAWEAGDQPQHPLFQHEFEPSRPGYTAEEAVQMGRSMETHQRAIAVKLLCGLLQRRAAVLALEPYASRPAANNSCGDAAGLAGGFALVMRQAAAMCEAAGAAVDRDAWGSNLADIRRCLVFALLHATAVDLPPSLPALLVAAVQSVAGKSRWLDKLHTVHLLTAFIASAAEEEVSADLWAAGGPWGAHGAPPLMQSQSRRSEQSYEASALGCVVDRVRSQQEQEEAVAENASALQSQMIQLALQCRYGNIDAMVTAGTLPPLLDVLLTAVAEVGAGGAKDPQGIVGVLQSIAEAVFFALAVVARGGDASSIDALVGLVRKHWQALSRLLLPSSAAAAVAAMRAGLLRLLAELSRRDQQFAAFLNKECAVASVLSLLLSGCSSDAQGAAGAARDGPELWGFRLWRVLLACGHGLTCVTELSVAARISPNAQQQQQQQQHAEVGASFVFAVGPGLAFRGAPVLVELLLLWEGAAVAVAAQAKRLVQSSLQPQSHLQASILEENVSFPVMLIDCVETARTLAMAAVDVLRSVIRPLAQKLRDEAVNPRKAQDEAVLAAALHYVASAIGAFPLSAPVVASSASDEARWAQVCEVTQLRSAGLHCVVRACEAFMGGAALQDSRVEVLRQQITLLTDSCASLVMGHDGASDAFAHVTLDAAGRADTIEALDMCLARSRLEQCLISWGSGVVSGTENAQGQGQHFLHAQLQGLERFAGRVAPTLPSVAMGLVARQRRRLQEMLLLSSVGTLCLHYLQLSESARLAFARSALRTACQAAMARVAGLLGPGMFAPIQALLGAVVGDSSREGASAAETQELVDAVLTGLLGKADKDLAESLSLSRHALLGWSSEASAPMGGLSNWALDPHRKQLPLGRQWPIHALYTLSGKSFADWLACLGGPEEREVEGEATAGAAGFVALRTAELFRVLRLASPEFIHKWLSPPAPNTPIHMQEVPEPFPHAVAAYFNFIRRLAFTAARASHAAAAPLQGLHELCLAASQEMEFSAAGVLATTAEQKPTRLLTAAGAASAAAAKNTSDNGVLELTGKLLESAAGQHVAPPVHAVALSVLLCPLLVPWRVSERVWRELGRFGLLHVIELTRAQWSPLLALTFCYAHPAAVGGSIGELGAGFNPLVARSALGGMAVIRGGADNRTLPVYAVAISTIAGAISGGLLSGPDSICISGRALRILTEVLDPSAALSCPDWLALDVLAHLLITTPRLSADAPALPPAEALDIAAATGVGDKFWDHFDAAMHFADEGPQLLWAAGDAERWEVQVSASETASLRDYVRRTRPAVA